MAGTPKSISMIKQILHLHTQGYGIKTISRNLGISKNTVKRYLKQAETKGLPPEFITSHSNESLEQRIPSIMGVFIHLFCLPIFVVKTVYGNTN